jgi:hypothetical protein
MKRFFSGLVFLFVFQALYGQSENPVPQLDSAVRIVARELGSKLSSLQARQAAVGQFAY